MKRKRLARKQICVRSLMAKWPTFNRLDVGSSPTARTSLR